MTYTDAMHLMMPTLLALCCAFTSLNAAAQVSGAAPDPSLRGVTPDEQSRRDAYFDEMMWFDFDAPSESAFFRGREQVPLGYDDVLSLAAPDVQAHNADIAQHQLLQLYLPVGALLAASGLVALLLVASVPALAIAFFGVPATAPLFMNPLSSYIIGGTAVGVGWVGLLLFAAAGIWGYVAWANRPQPFYGTRLGLVALRFNERLLEETGIDDATGLPTGLIDKQGQPEVYTTARQPFDRSRSPGAQARSERMADYLDTMLWIEPPLKPEQDAFVFVGARRESLPVVDAVTLVGTDADRVLAEQREEANVQAKRKSLPCILFSLLTLSRTQPAETVRHMSAGRLATLVALHNDKLLRERGLDTKRDRLPIGVPARMLTAQPEGESTPQAH